MSLVRPERPLRRWLLSVSLGVCVLNERLARSLGQTSLRAAARPLSSLARPLGLASSSSVPSRPVPSLPPPPTRTERNPPCRNTHPRPAQGPLRARRSAEPEEEERPHPRRSTRSSTRSRRSRCSRRPTSSPRSRSASPLLALLLLLRLLTRPPALPRPSLAYPPVVRLPTADRAPSSARPPPLPFLGGLAPSPPPLRPSRPRVRAEQEKLNITEIAMPAAGAGPAAAAAPAAEAEPEVRPPLRFARSLAAFLRPSAGALVESENPRGGRSLQLTGGVGLGGGGERGEPSFRGTQPPAWALEGLRAA